jgi:hypothetical protein
MADDETRQFGQFFDPIQLEITRAQFRTKRREGHGAPYRPNSLRPGKRGPQIKTVWALAELVAGTQKSQPMSITFFLHRWRGYLN